ncbi:MAG: radical SAM protein, partial [Pseudomonadota bacterium]
KPVVVGGPYPTSVPDELSAAGADFLVLGEGECSISPFLRALERGATHGVFRGDEKADMSTSPIPRYDLIRFEDYQFQVVQSSRGCPFDCEFCDIVHLYGSIPRYKHPDQVLEEFETIHRLGYSGPVFVTDDNFIGNKKHAKALLERIIQWQEARGFPFGLQCQASVNLGHDLEMIDLMTKANFGPVFVGIESPDEDVLRLANKRQNVQRPLKESIANINKNGLTVEGSFIIGFDGEKPGVDKRICSLVEETGIPAVMLNLLVALPGSKLWKRLEEEGRLLTKEISSDYLAGDRMNFESTRPRREVFEEFVRTWDYLYEPNRYLDRVYRYFINMRPTRRAMAKARGERVTSDRSKARFSPRMLWRDIRGGLILIVWQGILAPSRRRFWKNLYGMMRRNPSRLSQFLVFVAMAPDLIHIREMLIKRLEAEPHGEK